MALNYSGVTFSFHRTTDSPDQGTVGGGRGRAVSMKEVMSSVSPCACCWAISMAQRERISQEEVCVTWWFLALNKNNARVCEALSKLLVKMRVFMASIECRNINYFFLGRRDEWVRTCKEKGKEYWKDQTSRVKLYKKHYRICLMWYKYNGWITFAGTYWQLWRCLIMFCECLFLNFIVDIHLQENVMLYLWVVPFFLAFYYKT